MKTTIASIRNTNAGVLLTTLVITGIIGVVLASYLTLINHQNRSVARSQAWNATIALVEAGIEEALAHLNQNGVTNIASDGWVLAGTDLYRKETDLVTGRYEVTISIASPTRPEVVSRGFMPLRGIASSAQLALIGNDEANTGRYVSRQVRATTENDAIYAKGMVALNDLVWNGQIWSDSFDSRDPAHSMFGRYDQSRRKDNGSVASNRGNIDLGAGGRVYGYVATGPDGTVSNGKVGDLAWIEDPSTGGIKPGHYFDDMNVYFPDVEPPFDGGYFTPSGGTASLTNYTYGYTTVISDTPPDTIPPGGVITNSVTTVDTLVYPNVDPAIVVTNEVLISTPHYPEGLPDGTTVSTNEVLVVSGEYPNPAPDSGVNTLTTEVSSQTYPEEGTYVGTVTVREVTTGNPKFRGVWYDYNLITGYEYLLTTYSYEGPIYTYPVLNYTYTGISTNMTVTTGEYAYILDSGNYQLPSLSMSGQQRMLVRGDATLYVPGDIGMTGQSQIIVAPGARLQLYVGGDVNLQGNGVMNLTFDPLRYSLYGLPTSSNISLGGNAAFTGTIYAPQAHFSAGGGGNDQYDVVGAVIANTIYMNGHFTFHYDENLGKNGPIRGYRITSWSEE